MEDNRSGPPRYDAEAAAALLKKLGFQDPSFPPTPPPGQPPRGRLPLLYAAMENRPEEIKTLIDEGASVNERDRPSNPSEMDWTALHWAAFDGYPGTQFNRHF